LPLAFAPETLGKSASTIEYNPQNPHMLHYNLTIERQLPFDLGLTLGYAGSRGINLLASSTQEMNRDPIPPGQGSRSLRVLPILGTTLCNSCCRSG
jgi:hypothetical protein